MLSPIQLELVRLLGKKELSFGCLGIQYNELYQYTETCWLGFKDKSNWRAFEPREIIGHPATLSDFHRWLINTGEQWQQGIVDFDYINLGEDGWEGYIPYDSSRDFLDQEESTLETIVELITKNQ